MLHTEDGWEDRETGELLTFEERSKHLLCAFTNPCESQATAPIAFVPPLTPQGHAEAQAGASVRNHLAAIRRAAEEKEAELRRLMAEKDASAEEELSKLRDRGIELEEEVAALTAQLSRSQAELEAWERRLKSAAPRLALAPPSLGSCSPLVSSQLACCFLRPASPCLGIYALAVLCGREADEREASLLADLRDAESVASERDLLAIRVNALEDKLSETRIERGQIENYKQVARELEASKARAEEELVATARIVTGLEGRLRSSNREAEQCRLAMEASEQRVIDLERRMEEEVRIRVEACGQEKSKWPREAQAEVSRLEQKAEAVQRMLATIEEQLESETKARCPVGANRGGARASHGCGLVPGRVECWEVRKVEGGAGGREVGRSSRRKGG